MNDLEQRLSAALRARTDLVTIDRLTPAEPPASVVRPLWRKPAVYAVAAAACAAAIAAPFVLLGGDGGGGGPVGTPTPTPSAVSWPVLDRNGEFDVTGDGKADEVVLRRAPSGDLARVEVEGLEGSVLLEGSPGVAAFAGSVELDDGAGAEITVRRQPYDDGVAPGVDVLTVRDGQLTLVPPAATDGGPQLSGVVADGRVWGWWIEGDDLLSGMVEPGMDPDETAVPWRWRISTDGAPQLAPEPFEMDPGAGKDEGFARGSSPFSDASHQVIGVGGEFFTNLDGGGDDAVRLVADDGDTTLLEVAFDDGTTEAVWITPPPGARDAEEKVPTVHTTSVAARTPLLLVRWGGPMGITQVFDPSGQELRLLPFTSSFGSNADEEGGLVHSVLAEDGSFYALRQVGDEAVDVYRWEVEYDGDQAAYLVLGNNGRAIGRWCADGPDGAGWVTCT